MYKARNRAITREDRMRPHNIPGARNFCFTGGIMPCHIIDLTGGSIPFLALRDILKITWKKKDRLSGFAGPYE
jgi:hypothetical protein